MKCIICNENKADQISIMPSQPYYRELSAMPWLSCTLCRGYMFHVSGRNDEEYFRKVLEWYDALLDDPDILYSL